MVYNVYQAGAWPPASNRGYVADASGPDQGNYILPDMYCEYIKINIYEYNYITTIYLRAKVPGYPLPASLYACNFIAFDLVNFNTLCTISDSKLNFNMVFRHLKMAILVFTQIRIRCGLHITKSAEGDKLCLTSLSIGTIAPRTSCAAGPTAWGKINLKGVFK